MSDGLFFSVLNTDNILFIWIHTYICIYIKSLEFELFSGGSGVEGNSQSCSSAHLFEQSCTPSSPLWNPQVFHRQRRQKTLGSDWFSLSSIVKEVQPAKEGLPSLSKSFVSELTRRWMKHVLKSWRQISFQSPQTQFHWKSLLCLLMDYLLVPANGTSLLISLGAHIGEK